ncbi:hypothetical protein J6590_010377 [Homalodisca vitripennis]|nr:hypothetical protein J6590_010377 [Homalodisca vitripennis]
MYLIDTVSVKAVPWSRDDLGVLKYDKWLRACWAVFIFRNKRFILVQPIVMGPQ